MLGNLNLVDSVRGYLTPSFVDKLSTTLGENRDKTQAGLNSAVPGLLAGFDRAASTPEGERRIASAIDGSDDTILDNYSGMFGQGFPMESHLGSLRSITGAGTLSELTGTLARSSGLSGKNISSLLGFLAPLLFGAMKRIMRSRGLKSTDVASLLSGQRANISAAMPAGMGTFREPLSEVTEEAYTGPRAGRSRIDETERRMERQGSLPSWLLPLVLIAGALGLIWYLTSRPATRAAREGPTMTERKGTQGEVFSEISPVIRSKYQSVFQEARSQGVQFSSVRLEGGKLVLKGTAPSQEAANKVWDEIKRVNPRLDEVVADFSIPSSWIPSPKPAESASAPASGPPSET